ncbi:MAG: DUF4974 domain-containing protein [Tannerellaceae bacterium]|nr:DUF4974 domain-containing protein [Tannerellaceae bacterium]
MTKDSPEGTILLAYIKGLASEDEKSIVEDWLKEDEEHEKELLQIARIYHARHTYERIMARNPLPALTNVRRTIRKKKQNIWIGRAITSAACIAGVIILSTILSYQKENAIDAAPQLITVKSNSGMRINFTLPDGTEVYLNSGSTLSYPIPYDKNERRVSLTGEGFFNVTHNEKQPFMVNVLNNKLNVHVLGTKFNIQAYEEDSIIQTTLLSGSINLSINNNGRTQHIQMQPSDKAVYDLSTGRMQINKVNPLYETAWIESKLIFKDTPIPDVLKRLSHFYNVKFEVVNPVINSYRFTGTFQNRQLSQILDYLKISSNIDFKTNQTTEDDSNGIKHTVITLL